MLPVVMGALTFRQPSPSMAFVPSLNPLRLIPLDFILTQQKGICSRSRDLQYRILQIKWCTTFEYMIMGCRR